MNLAKTKSKPPPEKIKIVFWGTPEFAAPALKKLCQSGYKPALVVTRPDQPTGRGLHSAASVVKNIAREEKLKIAQPLNPNSPDFLEKLKEEKPDIFIVAAYGKILGKNLLAIPAFGALNIHPSLLPRYRGASPIQSAILSGDEETGATIILMDEETDHGPILTQKKVPINKDDTTASLSKKLAEKSADLLLKTLPLWLAGKISPQLQEESLATNTAVLTKEDGEIKWSDSAEEIARRIRAYCPWPGTFTHFEISGGRKILKIISAGPQPENQEIKELEPGRATVADKEWLVKCGEGALKIEKVQMEGKQEIGAKEFLNGYPSLSDKKLF